MINRPWDVYKFVAGVMVPAHWEFVATFEDKDRATRYIMADHNGEIFRLVPEGASLFDPRVPVIKGE